MTLEKARALIKDVNERLDEILVRYEKGFITSHEMFLHLFDEMYQGSHRMAVLGGLVKEGD